MDPFCCLCFMAVFFILFCLSIPCSIVFICWERADLLALLCVTFSCASGTFPFGVLGQVWYLIVSIPYLCLLPYLRYLKQQQTNIQCAEKGNKISVQRRNNNRVGEWARGNKSRHHRPMRGYHMHMYNALDCDA